MDKNIKSSLRFMNYVVDYIQFKNNPSFDGEEVKINFNITPNFDISENNKNMLVELRVEVFKDATQNNFPFEMELIVMGFFELDNIESSDIRTYKTNAVAIMYPYVRALITSYTANSNVSPLVLPVINVNKLIANCIEK